jgi:hypothetical protein
MRRDVRPKCAPTVFDLTNRRGSSIAAFTDSALTEALAQLVPTDNLNQHLMQSLVLGPQRRPGPQHAFGYAGNQRIVRDQLADPRLKRGPLRPRSHHQTKDLQRLTDLVLDVEQLAFQGTPVSEQ